MELVDDEDVETMIALYCGNRSDQNAPIHLFVELAGVEPTEDLTASGEEHGAQEPCMVAQISYVDSELTIPRINIDLNVTPDIEVVGGDGYDSSDPCDQKVDSDNPDATHVAEFPKYLDIPPVHRLDVDSDPKKLFVVHELEPHIFRQRMTQLESDMEATFYRLATLMLIIGQQQVNQMKVGHVLVEDVRDAMVANLQMARSMNVERVLLNVEKFVDDVYTLERTLRVRENEFPVLPDLST
ncbi:hypothetical protein GOBAR_DD10337 [Gossypium barbadense]|nr:hypothetical protein GOBAR_DD10337 [Gossypium barbadense]